jgi:hypothetical protein
MLASDAPIRSPRASTRARGFVIFVNMVTSVGLMTGPSLFPIVGIGIRPTY